MHRGIGVLIIYLEGRDGGQKFYLKLQNYRRDEPVSQQSAEQGEEQGVAWGRAARAGRWWRKPQGENKGCLDSGGLEKGSETEEGKGGTEAGRLPLYTLLCCCPCPCVLHSLTVESNNRFIQFS